MKTFRTKKSKRGALLIVAMLLCAIIGISLGSYLRLGRTALNISNRALYNNAAMNLAEQGLEEAMYSVNQQISNPSYDWANWTKSGSDAYREWTDVTLSQNSTASYRVYVKAYSSVAPTILARANVNMGGTSSAPIQKWIKIQLRKTSKFANGLVAKNSIVFSGTNASVDSWNSHSDTVSTADDVAYSSTSKRDNGSVGSISVSVDALTVNNADIWGYAATGGALPTVGPNGTVGPFGTTTGTMNMTRVSTDFSANFDPVSAPTTITVSTTTTAITYHPYMDTNAAITDNETLPRTTAPADPVSADGKYYISADSINFNNKTLTIAGNVVLKLTNSMTGIDIGGNDGLLKINNGASLVVYTDGDIKFSGNGSGNGIQNGDGTTAGTVQAPINCQFYGTKTSGTQDIQIAGNGALSAIVYAPQGSVKINGNGDVCGSVVASDIKVVGNASFHYDESLANFGGNNPLRISLWQELTTAADRTSSDANLLNWTP